MKQITINTYNYEELSPEAKKKALQTWRDTNDYMFMSDCMNNRLHELLEENNIKDLNDTSKAGTKPTPVLYSLSYSQGDGAMFEGEFIWDGLNVRIRHEGRYYHSNSKSIDITDGTGNEFQTMTAKDGVYEQFEAIYQKICKELEQYGYDFMEHEDSEEHFMEECEANEWMFNSKGEIIK